MNEVQVLGRTIKIRVVTQRELEKVRAQSEPDEFVHGAYISTDETIYISRALKEDLKHRTLLHELFHAYLDISGSSYLLNETSEEVICTLTENFLELFKNKQFVDLLNNKKGIPTS